MLAIYPRDFTKADFVLTSNSPNTFSEIMSLLPQGKSIGLLSVQILLLRLLTATGNDVSPVSSFLRWDYALPGEGRPRWSNEFLYLPWARSIVEQLSAKYHDSMRVSLLRFFDPNELSSGPMNLKDAERQFKGMDFGDRCLWLSPFGKFSLSLKSPDVVDFTQPGCFIFLRGAVRLIGG